ncbi:NAD(P)-dependent oxidoreductase [Achromobacter sp.]|uniref:precorrin-2 dehydrogenase/sirohydrochlorin ferrochelatase family protein n=1 Tax=Achromobacter sp. TaxID=134375 RepID=UPI003C739F01
MDTASAMLFPVFYNLVGRRVIVVGGGAVAERKIRLLLGTGAAITVGAPALTSWLQQAADQGRIEHAPAAFAPACLDGAWLAVAATDRGDTNQAVAAAALRRRIPCNVVDDPVLSTIQVPAILDRSPLVVAISSGGCAPVLARRIRERLEAQVDESTGDLARLAARYRGRIVARFRDLDERRDFYDWMLDGPLPSLLAAGDGRQACLTLEAAMQAETQPRTGSATILAAADGPADLLTLRALRMLSQADLVAHVPAVNPAILDKARRDAARIALKGPGLQPDPAVAAGAGLDWLARQVQAGQRAVLLLDTAHDPKLLARRITACGVACAVL